MVAVYSIGKRGGVTGDFAVYAVGVSGEFFDMTYCLFFSEGRDTAVKLRWWCTNFPECIGLRKGVLPLGSSG